MLTTEGQRDLAARNVIAAARDAAVPVIYCGVSVTNEEVDELLLAGARDLLLASASANATAPSSPIWLPLTGESNGRQ